jgi:hypothetical protein
MAPYSNFQKALTQGKIYEKKCLEYLEYTSVIHTEGYFKEYDLTIFQNGYPVTIEVKSDRQAAKTGNMVIEYECSSKGSGITTTTADYWMYFIVFPEREECYKFPIDDLKTIVKTCRKVTGGDGMRSKMHLLDKRICQKYRVYPVVR